MSGGTRLSEAISEGDGISLVALVQSADDAARVETHGAEAVLLAPAAAPTAGAVGAATSLPLIVDWRAGPPGDLDGIDACILDVEADQAWLAQVHRELRETLEIAFRIEDDEQLASALEEFDPEIFVLGASGSDGEEALERVLDLLADVPAGKLAIAELAVSTSDDVGALERAGFDGVIVAPERVADLVGEAPPDV